MAGKKKPKKPVARTGAPLPRVTGGGAHGDRRLKRADATLRREMEEEEERGVCMNCGGDMDYSPMHPWCPDCDEEDEKRAREAGH